MTKTGRDTYLIALYTDVLKSVKDFYEVEYQSHFDYTGSFELDKTKDSFGREFKKIFEEKIQIKNAINHRTLINVVKGGFALNAQKNTLNIFSQFIGYADFDDYCSKKQQEKVFNKAKGHLGQPLGQSDITKIISVFVVCLFLIGAYQSYKSLELSTQKSEILKTIEGANRAQFKSFKELPNINLEALEKYYLKNGVALILLKKIILKHHMDNFTIGKPTLNPSYYNIQNVNFQKITEMEAEVQTKEHWYLKWYNLKSKKYELKYDVSNSQFYKLVKVDDIWKIESNDYLGESKKIDE